MITMEKIFEQLNELGLFTWLDEEHNLANNRDITPEYLDNLPIDDIHRTVMYTCVFRFFRENHGLLSWVEPNFKNKYQTDGYVYYVKNNGSYSIDYATYEEAEVECIKKLIEIIKDK